MAATLARCSSCHNIMSASAAACPRCGSTERSTDVPEIPAHPLAMRAPFVRPWTPTPPFWIVTGTIFAVFVLLIAGTVVARTIVYTPQAAIHQYFAALKNRDAASILEVEPDLDQQSYAIKALQSRDYRAPDDLRIGKIAKTGDDSRSVEISYKINNQPLNSTITVVQNETRNAAGFFAWHPAGAVGGLQLQGAFFAKPKINGQPIPQNTDVMPALLPGGYRITNASNPLADIPDATVSIPAGAVGSAQLKPALRPDAIDKVNPVVTKYVDRCISSAVAGSPDDDCTFLGDAGIYGGETLKLGAYPKINLNLTDEGIIVSTATKGSITVSSDYSDEDQNVPFSVDGFAYLDSNNSPMFSAKS